MKRIGLLSDTHGFLDQSLLEHFANCDEVWHAGDVGTVDVLEQLLDFKPLRIVYGNIDGFEIRTGMEKDLWFDCEDVRVFMTHIGGYPGRYNKRVRQLIDKERPGLYICGHSHILKVIYDKKYQLLHMNPGACGYKGFHKVRTAVRFAIDGAEFKDVEVIELAGRWRQ